MSNIQDSLKTYYEGHLAAHKGNPDLEVNWGLDTSKRRYEAFLNAAIHMWDGYGEDAVYIDLGSGTGNFLQHLKDTGSDENISYFGIDVSEEMVKESILRHPEYSDRFTVGDVSTKPSCIVQMNGTFTVKLDTPHSVFWEYVKSSVAQNFEHTRTIIFNLMNPLSIEPAKQRDDLFFLDIGEAAKFASTLSNKYIIDSSYLPYEYLVAISK